MNILEFIQQGGKCQSKAGHWFLLKEIGEDEYPIKGWLLINRKLYYYAWTTEGKPHNLPYTHGLDLMPMLGRTSYEMISLDRLADCKDINDFNRIKKEK